MSERVREFNRSGFRPSRAPADVVDAIHDLVRNGQRLESAELSRRALTQYPNDPYLYMQAALSLSKLGESAQEAGTEDQAEEYWNAALDYTLAGLKVDRKDVRLLCLTAKTMRQLGEWDNSEAFYTRALRIDDRDKFTWTATGDMYLRWAKSGELDMADQEKAMQHAADCYGEALARDPRDQTALRKMDELLAAGYEASEDGFDLYDDALDLINEEPAFDPRNAPIPGMRAPALDMK